MLEDVTSFRQDFVGKLGKVLSEKAQYEWETANRKAELLGKEPMQLVSEKYKGVVELLNSKTEDLTLGNNTALYSTVVAGFIEKAMRPELLAQGVINKITVNTKGTNSIKIPVNEILTASDLPDTGDVTYDSSAQYNGVTIDLTYKYAANRITYPLIQMANADIIADQISEIGYALKRKIDSDIISAIDSAAPTDNSNNNYTGLASGSYIDYSTLVDAMEGMEANYGKPDVILTNPGTKARMLKDTDIKQALAFGTVASAGSIMPQVQTIFGMKLLSSTQVPANTTYLIDSKNLKYYVEDQNGVQTFDGRINGSVAQEVIGVIAYGVGIVKPHAVYKIAENTSSS